MEKTKFMQQTTFPVPNYETWKLEAEKSLKGKPFEKLLTNTYERITLQPLYTKKDNNITEMPGFPPFVRGTNHLGYYHNPWKIAQQLELKNVKEFNEVLKRDIEKGLTMIHPMLHQTHETASDFKEAFKDIDFEKLPILLDAHLCSLPVFSQFIAALNIQDMSKLSGTIGMDPLGALVVDGTAKASLARLYDVMSCIMAWANEHTPNLRTVLIKSEPYHNGGANAVQELAFAIATGVEYINECLNRGLTIDVIARQITFSFSIGANIFMEIAKLRAAKALWSIVVQEFDGNAESQKMQIHAQTSIFTKTIYDPYVNILRGTTEAFAAIVGGVDSLSVAPFDVAIGPSSDISRRIARNIQIILKDEVHLDKVIDPAGGSWYVESLTHEVSEKAWALFQQIESLGGMSQALQEGFVQENVANIMSERLNHLHHRQDKIVGTNYYANMKEQQPKIRDINVEKVSFHTLEKIAELANLTEAIKQNQDIVENAILAARKGATNREMFEAIFEGEEIFAIEPILQRRLTESFESIRRASENYKAQHGHFPKVGLINLGAISMHKARADFVTGFFEAGSFEVVNQNGCHSIDEVINQLSELIEVYIICGKDDQYREFVPEIAKLLKGKKVFVAGKQSSEIEKQFIEAGITGFIHMKSNCYETLKALQQKMGVQR